MTALVSQSPRAGAGPSLANHSPLAALPVQPSRTANLLLTAHDRIGAWDTRARQRSAGRHPHDGVLKRVQHLDGQIVAAVQVVRDREANPVGAVPGLQVQQRLPRLHEARQVAHLHLHIHGGACLAEPSYPWGQDNQEMTMRSSMSSTRGSPHRAPKCAAVKANMPCMGTREALLVCETLYKCLDSLSHPGDMHAQQHPTCRGCRGVVQQVPTQAPDQYIHLS